MFEFSFPLQTFFPGLKNMGLIQQCLKTSSNLFLRDADNNTLFHYFASFRLKDKQANNQQFLKQYTAVLKWLCQNGLKEVYSNQKYINRYGVSVESLFLSFSGDSYYVLRSYYLLRFAGLSQVERDTLFRAIYKVVVCWVNNLFDVLNRHAWKTWEHYLTQEAKWRLLFALPDINRYAPCIVRKDSEDWRIYVESLIQLRRLEGQDNAFLFEFSNFFESKLNTHIARFEFLKALFSEAGEMNFFMCSKKAIITYLSRFFYSSSTFRLFSPCLPLSFWFLRDAVAKTALRDAASPFERKYNLTRVLRAIPDDDTNSYAVRYRFTALALLAQIKLIDYLHEFFLEFADFAIFLKIQKFLLDRQFQLVVDFALPTLADAPDEEGKEVAQLVRLDSRAPLRKLARLTASAADACCRINVDDVISGGYFFALYRVCRAVFECPVGVKAVVGLLENYSAGCGYYFEGVADLGARFSDFKRLTFHGIAKLQEELSKMRCA